MSQLDNAVKQLRSLSLTAAASQLATLVAKAEANEISYLGFVQSLAEHELVQRNEEEMMKVRNLGRKSLEEVQQKLVGLGLSLRHNED